MYMIDLYTSKITDLCPTWTTGFEKYSLLNLLLTDLLFAVWTVQMHTFVQTLSNFSFFYNLNPIQAFDMDYSGSKSTCCLKAKKQRGAEKML